MKVKIDDVLEAIDFASNDVSYYYNMQTEEIVSRFDPIISGYYDEELENDLEENWDQYITLPTAFEINEYSIMEEFIDNLSNTDVQNQLYHAIKGKGAFRRFKDAIYNLNMEKQWFHYLDEAHKKIAIKWCLDNHIEYSE